MIGKVETVGGVHYKEYENEMKRSAICLTKDSFS